MRGMDARQDDFAEWMAARQPHLLRTAYLLTGDPHAAEDLLQTALAKAYLAWDRVSRADSIDTYVCRILINEHRSTWRRLWRKREVVADTSTYVVPVEDRSDDGASAALWSAVQTLPERQRAVIVLRYYEQLSEAETAQVLGVSVGTVKSQASRGLDTLRRSSGVTLEDYR